MGALITLLEVLKWIVIVDVVLSWIQRDTNQFPRSLTHQITAPLYAPLHALIKPGLTGGIDFTPILLIFLIQLLQRSL